MADTLNVSEIRNEDQLAVLLQALGLVCTVEEFPLKELNCDDGEDEHEENVNDEDVQHVLQRVDHTVEHRLRTHRNTHTFVLCKMENYF